jgi:hypothetical protein
MDHRIAFELLQKKTDGQPLEPDQQAAYHLHLKSCPDCRRDARLFASLRKEAALLWPPWLEPRQSTQAILRNVLAGKQRAHLRRLVLLPVRLAFWSSAALLLILAVVIGLSYLLPSLSDIAPLPVVRRTPAFAPAPTITSRPGVITGPDQTTQPTSLVPASATLEPIMKAGSFGIIGWSPGSSYLAFSVIEPSQDPQSDRRFTTLYFLEAASGQVCRSSESFLGETHLSNRAAWLPDDLLLVVNSQGELVRVTPCQEDGTEHLDTNISDRIVSLPRVLSEGDRIVLESEASLWLLDPATFMAVSMEVPPSAGPGTRFLAWSPSGTRLAIPRQFGERQEIALFDVQTGAVTQVIELPSMVGDMNPMVEWVRDDHLFVWEHSSSGPLLYDLNSPNHQGIRVIPEIIGISGLLYPEQVNFMGVQPVPENDSYFIFLGIQEGNITYIYDSKTGQVERLGEPGNMLFIFPGPKMVHTWPAEADPVLDNLFQVIWLDGSGRDQVTMQVEGHSPRNYPKLQTRLLPGMDQVLYASNQGVSRVSLLNGQLIDFWNLLEGENSSFTSLYVSPDGLHIASVANSGSSSIELREEALYYWTAR